MKKLLFAFWVCSLALFPLAGKEFFTDGGFETGVLDWHYVREDVKKYDGVKRRIEFSDQVVCNGNRSLHISVREPGEKADLGYIVNIADLPAMARGKMKLSVHVKAEKGTPSLAYYLELFDDAGKKQTRVETTKPAAPDGKWQELSLSFTMPEHPRLLLVYLHNCKENQLADVYWDSLSLSLEGEPDFTNEPSSITSLEAEFKHPAVVDSDVYTRPSIQNGRFTENEHCVFYTGVTVCARNPQLQDWDKKDIVDHFAYQTHPSWEIFEKMGVNSCHWTLPDAVINSLATGAKLPGNYRSELEKSRTWALEVTGIPVVATGFLGSIQDCKHEPKKSKKMQQRTTLQHDFLPWCPECVEGKVLYLARCEMLAREYFRLGLNVYLYELAHKPVYNCQCPANAKGFAEAAQKVYGDITRANEVWGTQFQNFEEVAKIQSFEKYPKLWPDWCRFSATRYRTFLVMLKDGISRIDRRNNVFFCERNINIFSKDSACVNFLEHTRDLDVLAIEGGLWYVDVTAPGKMLGGPSLEHLFVCDFFQAVSEGKKPVSNHQHNCIRIQNGKRVPSRREDLISSFWAELFHGLSASYVFSFDKRHWEWNSLEQAKQNVETPSFKSCSLLNPANYPPESLDAFQKFQQESGAHLQYIIPAVRAKKSTVAVLYSLSTLRMSAISPVSFKEPMLNWYGEALLSQYPVKIVFEDNLDTELQGNIKVLLLPAADYLPEKTVKEINAFISRGGKIIADAGAFRFDDRGNPRAEQPKAIRLQAGKGEDNARLCAELAVAPRSVQITDAAGAQIHALGETIEVRGNRMVLLFNLMQEKSCEAVVKFPDLPDGNWVISDAVRKEAYDCQTSEMTWEAEQLRKGIKLLLPGQERRILLITPGLPPGHQIVSFAKEQERAAKILKEEAGPKEPSAAEKQTNP